MGRLSGRVALVTGGSRGIGASIARTLAANGAKVAVAARTSAQQPRELATLADQIGGVAVPVDVSRPADVERMVADTNLRLGPVDILINNAGVVWPLGRTVSVDADEWESAVTINLFGAVRCLRAVLPAMLTRGYGRIVNLSSGAADGAGMPSASAYSAGKAALDMVTANVAVELADTGVTINGVRPGTADTGMQEYMRSLPREQVGEEFYERFSLLHREGRLADPALAAQLVLQLICSHANGLTVDVRSEAGRALLGQPTAEGDPVTD